MKPTMDKVDEEEEIGGRFDRTDLSFEPEEVKEVKVEIAEKMPVDQSINNSVTIQSSSDQFGHLSLLESSRNINNIDVRFSRST